MISNIDFMFFYLGNIDNFLIFFTEVPIPRRFVTFSTHTHTHTYIRRERERERKREKKSDRDVSLKTRQERILELLSIIFKSFEKSCITRYNQ